MKTRWWWCIKHTEGDISNMVRLSACWYIPHIFTCGQVNHAVYCLPPWLLQFIFAIDTDQCRTCIWIWILFQQENYLIYIKCTITVRCDWLLHCNPPPLNVTVHWNELFLPALPDHFLAASHERFAALQRQWMGCCSSAYLAVNRVSLP